VSAGKMKIGCIDRRRLREGCRESAISVMALDLKRDERVCLKSKAQTSLEIALRGPWLPPDTNARFALAPQCRRNQLKRGL
jgi:hypothetical protein